ncbi:MAG TPA: CRTAC1 family protein, partial [Chloroflexi bacterium]|nr:CRTAC1 family protein [Chloroflexota bacterium]
GMVMADLDADGDLDIVVNNLRGAAMLYENQLCGGKALEVELNWRDSQNPRAVGAQVRLQTSLGTLTRDLRASGGYLSGDPYRLHFGFPAGVELRSLTVIWPDGQVSKIDQLEPQTLVKITR